MIRRSAKRTSAGIGLFGITDLPSFVNVFVGQANVGDAWRFQSGSATSRVRRANLSALLRRIVFVGKAALKLATSITTFARAVWELRGKAMIVAKLIDWQPMAAMPDDRKDGRLLLLWSAVGGTQLGYWGGDGWRSDLGFQQSNGGEAPLFTEEKFADLTYWADINPPE